MKFLEPTRKQQAIYFHNSWEFGKSCEELSWNHCAWTPHRSETHGIADRAVRVKEGTSAVLLQSGLDEKWWADSRECYCYLRKIQDLLSDGKTPYERPFGKTNFDGPVIPFGVNGRISPYFCQRITEDYINLVLKSWQVYSSVMSCMRGESGKETWWSQTLKNWSRWTHQNSTPEGLNAKEVSTPMKGEKFIIPSHRWNSQNFWRRSGSENIHFNLGTAQTQEKNNIFFEENQKGLLLLHDKTHHGMMVKPKAIFGPMSWDFMYRHHAEHRVKLYVTDHSLFYQDYRHDVRFDVGETYWRSLECWWRSWIFRYVDWFHQIHLIEWKATRWIYMVQERDWRENKRPQGPINYRPKCGNICLTHQNVKRNKSELLRNQSSIMPEDCVGFYFIDLEDEEVKDIMRNARRKLEIPMPTVNAFVKLLLCRSSRGICRAIGGHKTKYACIVEADESMSIRMEGSSSQISWRSHCRKRYDFMKSLQSSARFFLCLKQCKCQLQRQQWKKKKKKNSRKDRHGSWRKSKTKIEVIAEARNEGRTLHFSSLMDLCHLKNSELEPQFQK